MILNHQAEQDAKIKEQWRAIKENQDNTNKVILIVATLHDKENR
jgi:hypothetical protein